MELLSERQIIARIEDGEVFSALIEGHAFEIKIDRYVPVIGTAIHHGHRVCSSLAGNMLITDTERKFEEDPHTGDFIDTLPITIIVYDSRYYYDLNRDPANCIYDVAWGKKVWKRTLETSAVKKIKNLHSCYYRVMDSLVGQLEKKFSQAIIYDLHSYNYSRLGGNPPLFNIGTHFIDVPRYASLLSHLQNGLNAIRLSGLESRSVCDEVFRGSGYQAAFINRNHPESLCVPLEIKKIFMDEEGFERNAVIFSELKRQLDQVLAENGTRFKNDFVRKCDE
jgi:hypothetical protein